MVANDDLEAPDGITMLVCCLRAPFAFSGVSVRRLVASRARSNIRGQRYSRPQFVLKSGKLEKIANRFRVGDLGLFNWPWHS